MILLVAAMNVCAYDLMLFSSIVSSQSHKRQSRGERNGMVVKDGGIDIVFRTDADVSSFYCS